jgi:molybdopterin-guanine dinucleotide biosynthesis protein A
MPNNKYKLKKIYNKPLSIILLHGTTKEEIRRFGHTALLPICGMPLILYQTNILRRVFPYGDLIIVSGENIESLEKVVENVRLVEVSPNVGSGYAALAGMRAAADCPILIIHGDNFFKEELFEGLTEKSTLIYNESPPEVGIIIDQTGHPEHLFYATGKNWCEIVVLYEEEIKLYKKAAAESKNQLTFELINKIIDDGGRFVTKKTEKENHLHIKDYYSIKHIRNLS